ncbi:zinc finger protein 1 homolog isoform X2 [Corythoichthys intestinalis]|nr:zinc finger protein 1 homolog isoform X2 [Corythoichthys intestinalis]
MQPQAKIRKTTPEPPRGKQGTQKSTKKPGLEDVITVEQETTNEHISIYTNTASLLSSTRLLTENVFSQVNISNQQSTDLRSDENRSTFEVISVHNQNPSLSKHSPSPKDSTDKTLNIPPLTHSEINISHVNSYSLKIEDTFETITKNSEKPFRAQDLTSKTFESTIYPKSKLTRRTTDVATIKSPLSSYTIRRLGLTNNKPGLTETRLRSSITKDTTPLKHKLTPESHKNCVSGKVSSCVKKTKISCPQDQSSLRVTTPPPRSRLTRNSTSPKECQLPPFGHNRSSSTKYVPLPKTPYCESLRSYTFSKEYTSKQMTRQSSSLLGKTASSSAGRPQMAKNSLSNTRESSAKKSRLNSPCSTLKNTVKIQNVKELTNLTKAQTIGTSLRETRSSLLPIQRDKRTPRAQNNFSVSPPTLSHQLIRIKAPNVVPPVQPLAVIGERLLKNQCGECGRVLSSSAALESHVSLHTGHRPFSCTLCGKSFPDAKGLKRHVRVHRNERIHICQQCGKDFIYGFGLTKHIQMVHGKIKPFACQICNKTFFTKRDVEIHLRIHTGEKPFHCDLCERKFTRKVELNVHLRWHNGEKRHWCPYCGKRFLDYNNLKRHKYIHTGEKPHSCPHCPKHFTQSGHLKKHVKNVHKVV